MSASINKGGMKMPLQPLVKSGGEWVPVEAKNAYPYVIPSIFMPGKYLGKGTIWQRDVSKMPLASNSAAMAAWMQKNTPDPWGLYGDGRKPGWGVTTSLNTSAYGTGPIALYVVDSRHPACPRVNMQTRGGFPAMDPKIRAVYSRDIPIPPYARPARNGDRGMAVYDVGTGIMREFFMVERSEAGEWKGEMGFSVNNPGLEDLAETNYATSLQCGSSAVARMHNNLGFIGINEVRAGEIQHALAFTFGAVAKGNPPSYPASGTDGKSPATEKDKSPVHGQWGRVRADVDPKFNPKTGAPYNPLTQLLIKAAQRYGLVGTDTNSWCHAFNAEDGQTEKALYGVDPWGEGGDLRGALAERFLADPARAFDVNDFPWDMTEWAPIDWGRPDTDFTPRHAFDNAWQREDNTSQ